MKCARLTQVVVDLLRPRALNLLESAVSGDLQQLRLQTFIYKIWWSCHIIEHYILCIKSLLEIEAICWRVACETVRWEQSDWMNVSARTAHYNNIYPIYLPSRPDLPSTKITRYSSVNGSSHLWSASSHSWEVPVEIRRALQHRMVGNAINFIQILSGGLCAADEGGLKDSLSWLNSSTTFCLLHLGHFLDSIRRGDGAEFPTLQLTIITDKSGNFIKFQVCIHSLTQSTVVAQISLRGYRFRSNNLENLAGDRFSFCSSGFPLN